jgi:hypothetical protein
MDRMPEPLTTFKEFVEADLRRAAQLIIKIQGEIDPQFRCSTPEGDYWIRFTFPDDTRERMMLLRRVSTFMAWKQAMSFTLASELEGPDCISCIGVSHREAYACLSEITRIPRPLTAKNFGPIEWCDYSQVETALLDLMPRGVRTIDEKEIAMLDKWFGTNGKFPAVHIASREVRGLQ